MNIVDLHNHLLPGVDDGAKTFDESLRHLKAFYDDGVTRVAVSPHLFGWLTEEAGGLELRLDRLEQVFNDLQAALANRDDVPQLFFSQEILCPTPDIARAVFANQRPGVRGTSWALVEFGFDLPATCIEIVRAVRAAGKRIVLSHPERYRRDGRPVSVAEIREWKQAGAALQVNGGSLIGDYGDAIRRTSWYMLHHGLADIISTDHHADYRVVSPRHVFNEIVRRGGAEQAELLMCENTARILDDRELVAVPALPERAA